MPDSVRHTPNNPLPELSSGECVDPAAGLRALADLVALLKRLQGRLEAAVHDPPAG
jgi:hypothetical protein